MLFKLIKFLINFTFLRAYMYLSTSNVVVNEEYLLFDTNSIIASVGGSMGLFLSFSILSFLDYFLIFYDIMKKLWNKPTI